MMALQVAGCALPPLLARRRRRAFRSPRAVASDAAPAAAREEDGKVALGGSGVAVTKLGIGTMATGRVRIGWSLRAPKTETRNRNPNPNPKPIRVEIHHQNQTRGYPKPEWIPETRG